MTTEDAPHALGRAEVVRLARDQLSGAAWAPFFDERNVIRQFGHIWVVQLAADRAGGPWIYADSRGRVRHVDFTSPAQRLVRIIALVVLLVGLAMLVSRFYPKRWCGTEVSASGVTRNICRDPEVTDPAIVALGVVILAALGVFYTEISGFGLSFRRRVDEANTNARESLSQVNDLQTVRKLFQETQSDLADANRRTEDRLNLLERSILEIREQLARSGREEGRRQAERIGPVEAAATQVSAGHRGSSEALSQGGPGSAAGGAAGNGGASPVADGLRTADVLGYAAEYNRCRSTMVAGPDRSARLEEVFSDMRTAVENIQISADEVQRALFERADRGVRLTAYAYIVEHPDPDWLTLVVSAASDEDKPFGQYCALRAVKELVKASRARLTPDLTARLNEISITAGRGTDRAREVATILAEDRRKPELTT